MPSRCCDVTLTVAPSGHSNINPYLFICACAHKYELLITVVLCCFLFFLQTIQAALRDEALFFQKNYPALASRNGTPFLARTLNKVYRKNSDLMMKKKRDTKNLPLVY